MRLHKKTFAFGISAVSLCTLLICSFAVFTSSLTMQTDITSGSLDIDVKNVTNHAEIALNASGLDEFNFLPGYTFDYSGLTVKNVGATPAWVRVRIETNITASDGSTLDSVVSDTGEPVVDFELGENWTRGSNGFYYYDIPIDGSNGSLDSIETKPLIKGVKVSPDVDASYAGCTIDFDVTVHAVQSVNNLPDSGHAMDINGWPDI